MGSWLRIRVGPMGYTVGGRRRPQSYRAYKQSRERRTAYAARYEHEQLREQSKRQSDGLKAREKWMVFAGFLLVVLLSPVILTTYLVRLVIRAGRRATSPHDATTVTLASKKPGPIAQSDGTHATDASKVGVVSPGQSAAAEEAAAGRLRALTPVKDARPEGSRIKGLTAAEFDGVTLPTLRYWLVNFWQYEHRSADRAEEMASENPELYAGRTREDHIRLIETEIDARTTRSR
jgi:hypothetical protein